MKKPKRNFWMLITGFVILIMALVSLDLVNATRPTLASDDILAWLPLVFAEGETPAPTETTPPTLTPTPTQPPNPPNEYVVIGWNDLGMHCYDQDYSVFSILPPYNTLWAQVIQIGDPPQIVTDTVKVEFDFPDNTVSDTKTNFWDYEEALFGINIPANTGLTGVGLSGEMEIGADGTYFIVEGIPLTEFSDSAPTTSDPYQLAHLVAKDAITDEVLADTTIVAPVSSEMRCDTCHDNPGHPGNFRFDILYDHDNEADTDLEAQAIAGDPILCADCHADPALGKAGDPDLKPLSIVIHKNHAEASGQPIDCYDCHPGDQTQCLRDVMSQPPTSYWCTDCHGSLLDVGNENRTPWSDEPRCETCHEDHAENPNTLFRLSEGHGGMYCEGCHNSTHAILPSSNDKDNLQSIALQGYAGQINECTVCHLTEPTSGGPHTIP